MFHVKSVSVWHLHIRSAGVFSSQGMRATLIHPRQVRAGNEMYPSVVYTPLGQGMNVSMNDTHNLGGWIYYVCSVFPIMIISMEDYAGCEGVGKPIDFEDCRYINSPWSDVSSDLGTVRV